MITKKAVKNISNYFYGASRNNLKGFIMKKLFIIMFVMMLVITGVVSAQDTLTFGTNAEFPPFEFVTAEGVIDEFDGIDMVIAKTVAEENGMIAKISNMEFDSLLIALQSGQIDAVIAGMTITEERKEAVNFTIPYYTATQVMIVKEGSDVKSAADLTGKKIVVVQGYTGETAIQSMGFTPNDYTALKKGSEAIIELLNGKADVFVIDSATAANYVADNEDLVIIEDAGAFGAEEYGIAVKKGNDELLEKLNKSIEKMLEDGTIGEITIKYTENSEN